MSKEERFIQWTKILLALVFLAGAVYVARDIHLIRLTIYG
jgi:uncharacterized membrane protein